MARLAKFSFHMLSLSHSSADAENKFLQINLLKTKQKNLLSTNSIIGLVQSQKYLKKLFKKEKNRKTEI